MNIYAFSRSFAAVSVLLGLPMLAQALNYGPLEIVGFGKDEFSICDNCSMGLVNPSSFDPRGVLNPPNPMVNQSSTSGRRLRIGSRSADESSPIRAGRQPSMRVEAVTMRLLS